MFRFLFAPMPITGHVNPGLPIARELVRRGHRVRWCSTPRFQEAIEATGARFVPLGDAASFDEAALDVRFPDRPAGGVAQLRYDLFHLFLGIVPAALQDLEVELASETADVLVADSTSVFSAMLHERIGIPVAVFGITVLAMPSRDTAPFGLSLMPSATPAGRLRNALLNWLVDHLVFRSVNVRFQELRRELGLPPFPGSLFELSRISDLFLQGSAPSFEYPRSDLLPQIRFVGATLPEASPEWSPPGWWGAMNGRPVVLLTQGTINNDFDQLIRPAIRALAEENVTVVVTTGNRPSAEVAVDPLPANVRIERFIPYRHLMPKVDLLLTNGGYGSIQIALAHGVPVVAIGGTEEKPEIANRVAWAGVGVGLKMQRPSEHQIRNAVRKVLATPSYRERARVMASEMAGLDAPRISADLLEKLARGRAALT